MSEIVTRPIELGVKGTPKCPFQFVLFFDDTLRKNIFQFFQFLMYLVQFFIVLT